MTLIAAPAGLLFPDSIYTILGIDNVLGNILMDAAGEKVAAIGHCYIAGRPAGTKTISAAGGGSIAFQTGAVTFANGGTTVDIGIQDVATGAGPVAQPDGTFDVKNTFTGGGGGITTGAWNTASMTGGTGSKAIAHGDLIAVTFDMTARGGADVVNAAAISAQNMQRPLVAHFTGSWVVTAGRILPIVITFDDGTLGTIDGVLPFNTLYTETFGDATATDERGMMFQIPWDCKVDAFYAAIGGNNDPTADMMLKLYSDPLGTPTLITSISVLSEQILAHLGPQHGMFLLPSEVSLSKNTDYALTVRATGGSLDCRGFSLGLETYRVFSPAGTTLKRVIRANDTGAFTADSPATNVNLISVRISQLDDGTGAGAAGGGMRLAGHGGLAA